MWRVELYRANGRFVKQSKDFRAKYGAKKLRAAWDKKYDETSYYTTLNRKV